MIAVAVDLSVKREGVDAGCGYRKQTANFVISQTEALIHELGGWPCQVLVKFQPKQVSVEPSIGSKCPHVSWPDRSLSLYPGCYF